MKKGGSRCPQGLSGFLFFTYDKNYKGGGLYEWNTSSVEGKRDDFA